MSDQKTDLVERIVKNKPHRVPGGAGLAPVGSTVKVTRRAAKRFSDNLVDVKVAKAQAEVEKALEASNAEPEAAKQPAAPKPATATAPVAGAPK